MKTNSTRLDALGRPGVVCFGGGSSDEFERTTAQQKGFRDTSRGSGNSLLDVPGIA